MNNLKLMLTTFKRISWSTFKMLSTKNVKDSYILYIYIKMIWH